MRLLLAFLLPVLALAQQQVVGNPTGIALGIFAMCGTDPINCGNGWCCLAGQVCTVGPNGANTMCIDTSFSDPKSGSKGVTVNAAYFQRMQDHQVTPGNGTTAKISTQQSLESSSMRLERPATFVMLSTVAGLIACAL